LYPWTRVVRLGDVGRGSIRQPRSRSTLTDSIGRGQELGKLSSSNSSSLRPFGIVLPHIPCPDRSYDEHARVTSTRDPIHATPRLCRARACTRGIPCHGCEDSGSAKHALPCPSFFGEGPHQDKSQTDRRFTTKGSSTFRAVCHRDCANPVVRK
jgi:hypothetical protein